jgi:hypothetical protein
MLILIALSNAVMHGVESPDDEKGPTDTEGNTDLLAYMAGQQLQNWHLVNKINYK